MYNVQDYTVLYSNTVHPVKIAERGKMDTPNTPMHDRSFSCIGTGTSIKSGGAKLVLSSKSPLLVK
jgi:hypothetical protein